MEGNEPIRCPICGLHRGYIDGFGLVRLRWGSFVLGYVQADPIKSVCLGHEGQTRQTVPAVFYEAWKDEKNTW